MAVLASYGIRPQDMIRLLQDPGKQGENGITKRRTSKEEELPLEIKWNPLFACASIDEFQTLLCCNGANPNHASCDPELNLS